MPPRPTSWAQGHLRVSRFNVRARPDTSPAKASWRLAERATSHLNATVEALNAESLMRSLRLAIPGRIPCGRTHQRAMDGDQLCGRGRRGAIVPHAPSRQRRGIDAAGRWPCRHHRQWRARGGDLRNVRAAGTDLNGHVTLGNRQTLDGTIRARSANVQSTINTMETFLGRRRGSLDAGANRWSPDGRRQGSRHSFRAAPERRDSTRRRSARAMQPASVSMAT